MKPLASLSLSFPVAPYEERASVQFVATLEVLEYLMRSISEPSLPQRKDPIPSFFPHDACSPAF